MAAPEGRNWLPILIPVGLIIIGLPIVLVIALRTQDDDNETSKGANDPTVAASPAGGAQGIVVTVSNFEFTPDDFSVDRSLAVTFRNTSQTRHHIKVGEDQADLLLEGGDTARWIANEPGEYEFICTIHPNQMRGTVTVR